MEMKNALLLVSVAVLLFGCISQPPITEPTPTPAQSATPTFTPTPASTPSPTPTANLRNSELLRTWLPILEREYADISYSADPQVSSGNFLIKSNTALLAPGQSTYDFVSIDSSIQRFQIVVISDKRMRINITSPSGMSSQNLLRAGEEYGKVYDFFSYGSPPPGRWTVHITNNNTDAQSYLLVASGQSSTAYVPEAKESYYLGEPIQASEFLMDNSGAISNARAIASVTDSSGNSKEFQLYDTGYYGDYDKDDGIFTNYITDDLPPGGYTLHLYEAVTAVGGDAIPVTQISREAVKPITILTERSPFERSLSINTTEVTASPGQEAILQVKVLPSASGQAAVSHTGLSSGENMIDPNRITVNYQFLDLSPSHAVNLTVSVRVPSGTPSGRYSGYLLLISSQTVKIPIAVDVSEEPILNHSDATLGIGQSFQLTSSLSVRLMNISTTVRNVSGRNVTTMTAEVGFYSGDNLISSLKGNENQTTLIFRNPGTGDVMFTVFIKEIHGNQADLVITKYATMGPVATPLQTPSGPAVTLGVGASHPLSGYNSIKLVGVSGGVAEIGYYSQTTLMYSETGREGETLEFRSPGSGSLMFTVLIQKINGNEVDVVITEY